MARRWRASFVERTRSMLLRCLLRLKRKAMAASGARLKAASGHREGHARIESSNWIAGKIAQ